MCACADCWRVVVSMREATIVAAFACCAQLAHRAPALLRGARVLRMLWRTMGWVGCAACPPGSCVCVCVCVR